MGDIQVPVFEIEIDGSPLPDVLVEQVQSVDVVQSLKLIDMAVLRFTNPHGVIADHSAFGTGKEVVVKGGYMGEIKELFKGEIVSLEPSFQNSGTPTVTVRAYDKLHRFRRGKKQRTFLNQKISDVVSTLINEEGLTPEVDDTGNQHEWLLQNNQSNVDYVHELARVHGYEVTLADGKLSFRKPKHSLGATGTHLEWGKTLKSFYVRCSLSNVQTQVTVRCWDMKAKEAVIEQNETGMSEFGASQVATAAAKKAFGDGKLQVSLQPCASPEEAKALATSLYNERALDAVKARATCLGDADLAPGQVVELQALGTFWSGDYYVVGVTHVLDPNAGFATELELRRSGVGG